MLSHGEPPPIERTKVSFGSVAAVGGDVKSSDRQNRRNFCVPFFVAPGRATVFR
jgi:hypothetical protein